MSGDGERASRSTRPLLVGAIAASALYVVAWAIAASSLTFYWDDYFLILTQADRSFIGSLTTGINGNWWPLATLLQRVEVWLFGPWYAGYLIVNALLCLAIAWFMWFALAAVARRRPWLLAAALVLYACSLGVLVNVSVMTASWPLSVALATLSALLLARGRSIVLWLGVLVLSLLADSGLFAVNATIVAAVAVVVAVDRADAWWPSSGTLARAGMLVAGGMAGTLVGNAIASRDPIDYYASAADAATSNGAMLPSVDLVATVQATIAFAGPWLAAPLIPLSALRNSFLTWQVVLVAAHLLLVVLAIVVAGVGAAIVVLRSRDSTRPRRLLVIGVALAIPVVETAAILAAVRSGNGYAPRYALAWLLPAAALWSVVLAPDARSRAGRAVASACRVLLVVSAATAVVLLPVTIRSAVDTDNQRWDHSASQREQMRACLRGEAATPEPDVSPGLLPDDFCRFVGYLRESSLPGSLLD